MTKLKLVPCMISDDHGIDQEHGALGDALAEIYDLLGQRDLLAAAERARAFERMLQNHFDHEAELMARYRFPNVDAHLEQHTKSMWQVRQLVRDMEEKADPGGAGRVVAVAALMTDMLTAIAGEISDHVMRYDTALGHFLSQYALDV
jgi:hemerythrin-like metal-binding protein